MSDNLPDNFSSFQSRAFESRRRLIRDVTAATGWIFLNGATISRAAEASVVGDSGNNDKAWGTVKGRVVFDGDVPKVEEVNLDKAGLTAEDLNWFKSMGPVLNQEWVIDQKSKAIQWVCVWLIPEEGQPKFKCHESLLTLPEEKKFVVVDQEPSGYVPRAIALQLGQGILMRNQGPVGHVFNFSGFANDSFNRAMAPKSEMVVKDLKLEKSTVQINCPPHPWERMWMRMFDHPYFAITASDGSFEIKLAPVGKCRIVVWHEKAGFLGGKNGKNGSSISVAGGAVTDLGDLKLKPKV